MAETDNNAPGGNDPLKMRNTETAALKRIPVSPNSASASSAARKTIKLKPLVPPSAAGGQSPSPAPAPKSVTPPSILMNRKPAAPTTEETPKFMSTNTAPIGKMTKPEPEKPIPSADLNDAPTKTVSIPRLQAKMASKPVIEVAPEPAAPAPAATATVSVPKITKPETPAPAAPAPATVSVPKITPAAAPAPATVSVPKITPAAAPKSPAVVIPPVNSTTQGIPKQTVAPKSPAVAIPPTGPTTQGIPKQAVAPKSPAVVIPPTGPTTQGIPKQVVSPKSPTVIVPAAGGDTTTQGIQKQAIDLAKMQSGLQGAKPAIKLRPSASPAQAAEEPPQPASPPTIKLTPKPDSAVSPVPPAESAEQTASDVTVTTKIPRKTLQLKPKMPAAKTEAKLKEQGDIANQQINSGVEEGDQTIQQSGLDQQNQPPVEKNLTPDDKDKKDKAAGEPNIIFSICAILAFLVIGYTVFALTAQFLSIWEGKQIPVAGFQQIYESSKK